MSCDAYRNDILLAESGELAAEGRERLAAHLAGCAVCRAYADDVGRVLTRATEALAGAEPSAAALARIGAAAAGTGRWRVLRGPVRQALAYAAALTILAGGWFLWRGRPAAQPVAELHALVAMMTDDDALVPHPSAVTEGGAGEAEMRALARQLLQLEGMAVEESGGEEETVSPAAAPSPTALRPRSSAASRPGRCV